MASICPLTLFLKNGRRANVNLIKLKQQVNPARCLSTTSNKLSSPMDSSRLEIERAKIPELKEKPPVSDLVFGKFFTDHMLSMDWDSTVGWHAPKIEPFKDFSMHPGAKVLHYAQELFEGMKAYRGVDGKIRMFRPMHNMARMNLSASRSCLPNFDGLEVLNCIRELVRIDSEWVPHDSSSSLYIRPTMIGTEPTLGVSPANEAKLFVILCPVGPYYSTGFKPVNLLCDPSYVRAFPGGCGFTKMGSNYAPTLWTQKVAEKEGCHQCLWLYGADHEITEVGAMNIFVLLKDKAGGLELVTPPISSQVILPGVTRRSIVEMVSEWDGVAVNERRITMKEVMEAKSEGRLVEMFGSGTAAVVSPVGGLHYEGVMHTIDTPEDGMAAKIMASMSDIYYGVQPHPWAIDVEAWDVDTKQILEDYKQPDSMAAYA